MADRPCFRSPSARGWLASGLIVSLVAGLGGCGEPFKLVPLRGKVTYSDGSRIYLNYAESPVTVEGITIDRYKGGKVVESWTHWDALGLMRQLGVAPTVGAIEAKRAAERQRQRHV